MRLPIMDTRKLLEELENVINNASEVPFTNKKMVDKDEVERLIDAMHGEKYSLLIVADPVKNRE
jgi:tRNA U54 and U55 pseudouridine synthase Pus10